MGGGTSRTSLIFIIIQLQGLMFDYLHAQYLHNYTCTSASILRKSDDINIDTALLGSKIGEGCG